MKNLRSLLTSHHGATSIEYAMIATLISIAAIAALITLGGSMSAGLININTHMDAAMAAR